MAPQPHSEAVKALIIREGETSETDDKARQRRSKRRRWSTFFALSFVVAVWFAPQIVAATALRQWLAHRLLPEYQGTIEIRGAQFGWLSPVEFYGVALRDLKGTSLVEIEVLRSDASFLRLVSVGDASGALQLKTMRARIDLKEQRSHFEAMLRKMVSEPSFWASTAHKTVSVTDGCLEIVGGRRDTMSRIDRITAELGGKTDSETAKTKTLRIQGTVDDEGAFVLELADGLASDHSQIAFDAKLTLKKVPAGGLYDVVACIWPSVHVEGVFDASLQGRCVIGDTLETSKVDLGGRIDAANFAFEYATGERSDRVAFKSVAAGGHVDCREGLLQVDDLRLRCDLGKMAATGTAPLALLKSPSLKETARFLERNCTQASLEIDLAKTSELFPDALGLRDNVEVNSGTLRAEFASRKEDKQQSWSGKLDISHLSATYEGRVQHWNAPLSFTFDAHRNADDGFTHRLSASSEFWSLSGGGTLREGKIETACDFDRFTTEVGRFVDLSGIDLGGQVSAKAVWQPEREEKIRATGSVLLNDLRIGVAGYLPWNEEHLEAEAGLAVSTNQRTIGDVESGWFRLASGDDALAVSLVAPSHRSQNRTDYQTDCRLTGNVATWSARLATLLGVLDEESSKWSSAGWNLAGRVDAQAKLATSAQSIRVLQGRANLSEFRAYGRDMFITDSPVRIDATGEWEFAKRRWSSPKIAWISHALSATLEDLTVEREIGKASRTEGSLKFRGEIRDLLKWTRDPAAPMADSPAGVIVGRADLRGSEDNLRGNWAFGLENFSLKRADPGPQTFHHAGWSDPEGPRYGHLGSFAGVNSQKRIALESDQIPAPLVIADVRSSSIAAMLLTGTFRYETQKDALSIEKFEFSPADGEPRWSIKPTINHTKKGPSLQIEKSPLVTNASLTSAACGSWFKYLLPIVANSVDIAGSYSVEIERASVPVFECNATEATGMISIPSAQLRGGLSAQLAAVAKNLEQMLLRGGLPRGVVGENLPVRLANQRIPMQISGGRVYHRGLEFLVGNAIVRTEGSVGWDDSLSLVASIPIREEWIRGNPRWAGLRGRVLRIPVTGTLSRPQIDARALAQFAAAQERLSH